MEYKRTYRCGIVTLRFLTDNLDILKLIENQIDLPHNHPSKPVFTISFHILGPEKRLIWFDTISWRKKLDKGSKISLDFRDKLSTVTIDVKTAKVQANIYHYSSGLKAFIWDTAVLEPMRLIFASRGFLYLHAAVLQKNNDCILMTGPSTSGKTTLSLILANKGYDILSDDDCFIKQTAEEVIILPFRRNVGLNKYNLKRHPWFKKYILRHSRHWTKKRFALSAVFGHFRSPVLRPKHIIIVFPRFKKNAVAAFKLLTIDQAVGRIDRGPKCRYSDKEYQETFWKSYELLAKCDLLEVIHNNKTVFKTADLIHAQFKPPRP